MNELLHCRPRLILSLGIVPWCGSCGRRCASARRDAIEIPVRRRARLPGLTRRTHEACYAYEGSCRCVPLTRKSVGHYQAALKTQVAAAFEYR
jgi:hypothetical protein